MNQKEVIGFKLPDDYLSFMQEHHGGEGSLEENSYGCFFKLEELQKINDAYNVQKLAGSHCDRLQLWVYYPEKRQHCRIDSCNTDDDTYVAISDSLMTFLLNMDKEPA